jgi:ATP-dependent Lhr-like helicase
VLYVSPLKALAVDVERNLRTPIAGIVDVASARGDAFVVPDVAIRTGDTPSSERARFTKSPTDILITTPESLYLMLASRARHALASVTTVIVDEIHALAPTKRGAHLALSLERLETLTGRTLQRIGLSATVRPVDEVAQFLGGVTPHAADRVTESPFGLGLPGDPRVEPASQIHEEFEGVDTSIAWRPVTIVDARVPKRLELRVEVPVEDMARLARPVATVSAVPPVPAGPEPSIWASVTAPAGTDPAASLDAAVRQQRRLAERLAGALNELAGEARALAPRVDCARAARGRAAQGRELRALVATSSLELIDMGAIDLVIRSAPPSVASGLQRIGRASHQVNAASTASCSEVPRRSRRLRRGHAAMHEGAVEAIRYPRNPLDVLAQQVVAMSPATRGPWARCLASSAARRRSRGWAARVQGVLDMLSGRYPSDEFAELRRASRGPRRRYAHRPRRRPPIVVANAEHSDRGSTASSSRARSPARTGRRARRGDVFRVARRRDLHARGVRGGRGDHARSRDGVCRAGRAGPDAVLEGRP